MMPTNVAARMTLAADPDSLQGAVAAGILGCGPVVLGTAEECARMLEQAQRRWPRADTADVAEDVARASTPPAARRPGSGIRSTSRSTRGPSGSWSSPTSAASRRRTCARALPSRTGSPRPGAAPDDERLAADRRRAARSRLPVGDGQGDPDPRAHRRPARAPRRGAAAADRLPDGGARRGGDRVRASRRRVR